MVCYNCDPSLNKPGRLIKVAAARCIECGDKIISEVHSEEVKGMINWDTYFLSICNAVASKSPCLSRKIGAILVRDKSIVSTGYNGPPRGVPHCGHERLMADDYLAAKLFDVYARAAEVRSTCPRKLLGYESGTHMELCPAQHAEENAISNAARLGVSTVGTILYMNSVIPCSNCYGTLINAGIVEIVVEKTDIYDEQAKFLIKNSNIPIRKFKTV